MSRSLPEGWAVTTVEEVAQSVGGGTPSKSDSSYWVGGTVPWVSPKDMKVFSLSSSEDQVTEKVLDRLSLVPPDSVLVVVRSGILSHTFPVALNTLAVTINQDMRAFLPRRDISARYLAWQLVAKQRDILSACSKHGTTVASIEGPALARFQLALAPAKEQILIVAKLEELLSDLDAGVAELKAAQKKLTQYRQSLLKSAVEGALTAEWRKHNKPKETGAQLLERILKERRAWWEKKQLAKFKEQGKAPPKGWREKYREPAAPETKTLPELPESWVWASVEQLSVTVVDGVHKKPTYVESGVPFVTVRNLTAGPGICFENLNYISRADHEEFTKRTRPERGDILVSKDGTLGVTRVVDIDRDFSIFVSVAMIKPVFTWMSDYLGVAVSSPVVQKQMVPKGSGLVHIHLEDLRRDCVPLPPQPEQRKVLDVAQVGLNEVDSQEAGIAAVLKQCSAQRKNILKAAFSGQLVPQDPNDEPASVLLERIRAERLMKAQSTTKRAVRKRA